MKKFSVAATTLAVALAAPLAIGIASAQSVSSSSAPSAPTFTQACVDALVAKDGTSITASDAMHTAHIAAIQAHKAAIIAAGALTDATAKTAAFKKAETDFRTAMKTTMDANRTAEQAAMKAVQTACGLQGRGMGTMDGKGLGMRGQDSEENENDNGTDSEVNEGPKGGFMGKFMKGFKHGHKGMKPTTGTSSSTSSAL